MNASLSKQHLFVIGSPRSGTTWLQILLAAHPSVATTVEQTIYSHYTAPWIKRWREEAEAIRSRKWDQGLPFLWTEEEFDEFLREFIARVYDRMLVLRPNATHILDKHPDYTFFVADIKRLLPKAKFIHILRDGRDVARSMVGAAQSMGFGAKTMPEAASEWKRYVTAALKAREFDADYLEIRYETLMNEGLDTLQTVFTFCGLPSTTEETAAIYEANQFEKMKARNAAADPRTTLASAHYRKGKTGVWREEMPAFERYTFDRIAGALLREIGYAGKGWWVCSPLDRVTLPVRSSCQARWKFLQTAMRGFAGALLGETLVDVLRKRRRLAKR